MARRLLVALVVAALVLAVPTAAVTVSEDDAGAITMEPYNGSDGNGQYAAIDGSGDIEVNFTELNANAVTTAHNVFNVTADEGCTAVWVEVDNATAYLGDDPSTPIDTSADAVEVPKGDTIAVGFEIATDDTAPDTDSMTVHATECTAGGGPGDGGDSGDGTDDDTDSTPTSDSDSDADFEADITAGVDGDVDENTTAVTIRVIVTNTGDATGSTVVRPTVNGSVIAERAVTLEPGETRELTFDHQLERPGTYTISANGATQRLVLAGTAPEFRVTSLTAEDSTVQAGNGTQVVATVENVGDEAGTYTAVLTDNGTVVASQEVSIPAGESRTVTFSPTFDQPGPHSLRVGSERTTVTVEGTATVRIVGTSVGDRRILPGNATTLAVTLENAGSQSADRTLDVTVAGVVVDTVTVTVPAGETRTYSVERRFDSPGVYAIAFDGVGAGDVTVAAGDTTADRILQGSFGVVVIVPLLVGLLLALWRRRLFEAVAQRV
jgi:hypothetical protein